MNQVLSDQTEKEMLSSVSHIPTLVEAINIENRTHDGQSHWLREAVLKEVVSKHRATVEELAQLMLILNRATPDLARYEVKDKLTCKANILVQECIDECLPSIEHHLRLLLEKDLERQINRILD